MKRAMASPHIRAATTYARPHVPTLDSLDEITEWLGTFRERLRIAHINEQGELQSVVRELEAHYDRRRAELA